eukprot:76579-Rhodomonas_salina.1
MGGGRHCGRPPDKDPQLAHPPRYTDALSTRSTLPSARSTLPPTVLNRGYGATSMGGRLQTRLSADACSTIVKAVLTRGYGATVGGGNCGTVLAPPRASHLVASPIRLRPCYPEAGADLARGAAQA